MAFLAQGVMTFGPLLVSAAFVLMLDQASKTLVLGTAHRRPGLDSAHGLFPRVRVRINRRAGIVLLPCRYMFSVWGIAVPGTILLIQCVPPLQAWGTQFGLGIALGGATGNLIDVARRGAVVDFIDLRIWPVFNLADACIVLGAGGALWSLG